MPVFVVNAPNSDHMLTRSIQSTDLALIPDSRDDC